ncbi:MAG: hypothetical protein QM538_06760 [Methylacidiphilales bacterium]|nr:hypothetical protein [Candidatus Methylacidiphilales bacterium]
MGIAKARLICKSYAKINLRLKITGKTEQGYHTIQSQLQYLSIYDTITIATRHDKKITITYQANQPTKNPRHDLMFKAAKLMGVGADILINKKIPIKAGLGGGSSNAAMVVLALIKLYRLRKSSLSLAKQLGSDVSFFLQPYAATVSGTGTRLTKRTFPQKKYILIVPKIKKPSTKKMYSYFDQMPTHSDKNDFDLVACRINPTMRNLFHILAPYQPMLCGSGFATVVQYKNSKQLSTVKRLIKNIPTHSICVVKSYNKVIH